jgi:hypothetical protein
MNYSAILFSAFLSVFATASVAQQPTSLFGQPSEPIYLDAASGARIDLDAVSGSGAPKVVFARVSFVENVGSRSPRIPARSTFTEAGWGSREWRYSGTRKAKGVLTAGAAR